MQSEANLFAAAVVAVPWLARPIENPKLVGALARLQKEKTEEGRTELTLRLREAVFLIPVRPVGYRTGETVTDAKTALKANPNLEILVTPGAEGRSYLPVFTDWRALREWSSRPANTLVMTAQDVWPYVLAHPPSPPPPARADPFPPPAKNERSEEDDSPSLS